MIKLECGCAYEFTVDDKTYIGIYSNNEEDAFYTANMSFDVGYCENIMKLEDK